MMNTGSSFTLNDSIESRREAHKMTRACATKRPPEYDNGFYRAAFRNLVPSRRHGASGTGPSLSGNIVPPPLAQLAGAGDALARRMCPPGGGPLVDGHVYSRYPLPARHTFSA